MHGYLLAIGFWLVALMVTPLLLGHGGWLALTPFAWTFGASAALVLKSKLLYVVLGLVFLGPRWPLLRRPQRVLEQSWAYGSQHSPMPTRIRHPSGHTAVRSRGTPERRSHEHTRLLAACLYVEIRIVLQRQIA